MTKRRFTADQLAFTNRHSVPGWWWRAITYVAILVAVISFWFYAFFAQSSETVRNVADWLVILSVLRSLLVQFGVSLALYVYVAYLNSDSKPSNADQKMAGLLRDGIRPSFDKRQVWYWCITTALEVAGYVILAASAHFKSASFLVIGHLLQEFVYRDAVATMAKWLRTLSPRRLVELDGGLSLMERDILSVIADHCRSKHNATTVLGEGLELSVDEAPQSTFFVAIDDDWLRLEEQRFGDLTVHRDALLASPTSMDQLLGTLDDLIMERKLEAGHRRTKAS